MMKIVVAGGSGFIGRTLVQRLASANHNVVVLTRKGGASKAGSHNSITVAEWDGRSVGEWSKHLDGSDAVINLAGELIAGKRWTNNQKALIMSSRVDATKALVGSIAKAQRKPRVFISASAVGYYGAVEAADVFESAAQGSDFLADVCGRWEAEALVVAKSGVRVVIPRLGVVLENDGGALKKMLLPFKLFAGGPLGSGSQWFPWIHRDDVVGVIMFALEKTTLSGPVNAAAPEPATMKQFCKTLGEVMRRPAWAPVPAFVLKVVLGEMSGMLLTGQRVVPKKAIDAGYQFQFPSLKRALEDILRRSTG